MPATGTGLIGTLIPSSTVSSSCSASTDRMLLYDYSVLFIDAVDFHVILDEDDLVRGVPLDSNRSSLQHKRTRFRSTVWISFSRVPGE